MSGNSIKHLPAKSFPVELDPEQPQLPFRVERQAEINGVGMGVLQDGTAFLTGRGLARLLDIENLHVRTISAEWNEQPQKPRIGAIKSILDRRGLQFEEAHIACSDGKRTIHAYPDAVCLAILEYYAFDAAKPRERARNNYRILAGKALQDLVYSHVGYDPEGKNEHKFARWHERISMNFRAAPRGYFHVFNECSTIIFELIRSGCDIGEKTVVDISVGSHWSRHWEAAGLATIYGGRVRYEHNYPDSHAQSAANPHHSWCYPQAALGAFRGWLQDSYIEGGKFAGYLHSKASRGELPPSVAQLAIATVSLEGPDQS